MQHTKKFTSSTPTSILSSSDSKSSGNKTVRFADEQRQTNTGEPKEMNNEMSEVRKKQTQSSDRRGSYEGVDMHVSLSSDQLERQRLEIISRTKLSLEHF